MLSRIAIRFLKYSKGLALLNVLAIAIGVSIPLAVELANHSVLAAFRATLDVVSGKANLEVSSDGQKFPEEIFGRIKLLDEVKAASPVIEATVLIPDFPAEYLRVIGVDFFSYSPFSNLSMGEANDSNVYHWITQPSSISLSEKLAAKLQLKAGDHLRVNFEGSDHDLVVRELIHYERDEVNTDEHVAIMDIAAAQALTRSFGKISRIDLLTSCDPNQTIKAIQSFLPEGVNVRKPERRGVQVENMLNAFQLNLFALSLIAIIVAMFLFNSSLATLIIRQRSSMGILRSIGFLPQDVQKLMYLQAFFITLAGVIVGTFLGFFLARFSLGMMSQVVSSLYLLVHVQTLAWTPSLVATVWLICFLFAFLAAWLPARESAFIEPLKTFQSGFSVSQWKQRLFLVLSVVFIFLGFVMSYFTFASPLKWLGFGAALCGLIAIACWIPVVTTIVGGLVLRFVRFCELLKGGFGITADVGVKQLLSGLKRPSIAAAALMTAFSMMLGTSILIDSFRKSVEYWIHQTIQADIYLAPVGNLQVKSHERIPDVTIAEILKSPEIEDYDTHHEIWFEYPERDRFGDLRRVKLSSNKFDVIQNHHRFLYKGAAPDLIHQTLGLYGILINESFSNHFRKKTGDVLELSTPSGRVKFRVLGVFYDYSTDSGQLVIDRATYNQVWHDPGYYSLALYLKNKTDVTVFESRLKARFPKSQLAFFSNQELRTEVLRVFDQTFAITLGLRLIAVIVAATGMFFTLTSVIIERSREWAILRSLGFSIRNLFWTSWIESMVIAMVGWLGSCLGGVVIAWLLAFVINKAYFGWTVQWYVNPWFFLQALGLAVFASTLACVLSLVKQVRVPLTDALRYE